MVSSSITSSEVRLMNRYRVLHAVYDHKEISKQDLSMELSMSLPTVTQNLKEFEALGFIRRQGLYESTGGRKAQIYHFAADAYISIGVVLLKELYRIVAVDLYGKVIKSEKLLIPFSRTENYFTRLGAEIDRFVSDMPYRKEQILGTAIALQGLVSADGSTVIYGEILNCTGLTLEEVQKHVSYPCTLIHDTEASAIAEIWARKDLKDFVLLSLTRNFGGAVIINRKIHRGESLSSGIIEHMRLYPDGRPCYCGKKGCIEAYCSAYALQAMAGEPLESFFPAMHAGDESRIQIWNHYLHDLAIAINNIRMLIDSEYIISGYLQEFMDEKDFQKLAEYADRECPFEISHVRLCRSVFSDGSAAPGAAISLVEPFLDSI